MKKQAKYSREVIERAVRVISEAGGQYESQWAAITSLEWREDKALDMPVLGGILQKYPSFRSVER
jgi:hypothetical protein